MTRSAWITGSLRRIGLSRSWSIAASNRGGAERRGRPPRVASGPAGRCRPVLRQPGREPKSACSRGCLLQFGPGIQVIGSADGAAARPLDGREAKYPAGARYVDAVAGRGDDLARLGAGREVERARRPDTEAFAGDIGLGNGPGVERPDLALEGDGRKLEVQPGLGLVEFVGVLDACF